jgi:hypothetical protein
MKYTSKISLLKDLDEVFSTGKRAGRQDIRVFAPERLGNCQKAG